MKFAFRFRQSPVAYCALHVKTGTRYEGPREGGLAHFTEHLLFKGTEHRSAAVVNSYIDKLGGELNAYTTKEETVIHATVLREDLNKAVNLIMDIAFCCIFPEKEVEKERGVVLEEINTYKDSPSEQIYDDFEEYLFQGTPLSMPVLGKAKYLRKAGRTAVANYYRRMFRPENMYFTVVAQAEENRALRMVARALSKYSDATLQEAAQEVVPAPAPLQCNPAFNLSFNRHSHQAHCILGSQAYSAYDRNRIALSLLLNILGGPVANSRLNMLLREKYGLVYSVDASYNLYSDAGVAAIYFGCEKANLSRCTGLIENLLTEMREKPMSPQMLSSAKKQYMGQMAIASDNGEARVLAMGKSLMTYGRVVENSEIMRLINEVTVEDLMEVARDVFDPDRISTLIYT